jgi:hypothetical protein
MVKPTIADDLRPLFCINPTPVDIQRPSPVCQHILRNRADQRFAGDGDGLKAGLQRSAPPGPLLGFGGGGGRCVRLSTAAIAGR